MPFSTGLAVILDWDDTDKLDDEVPHLVDRQLDLDRLGALGLNARSGLRICCEAATKSRSNTWRSASPDQAGRRR
jgi:hypothetical protein